MELGEDRLEACPEEGVCTPDSKPPEEELWCADTADVELLEEAPCLERELEMKGDL